MRPLGGAGGGEEIWGGRCPAFLLRGPPLVLSGWERGTEELVTRAHLSTTKAEALWLTEAECSAHLPLGSSRVWMV